jgi:hypothetical protein
MKIRLLALVGLAIGFALPAIALEGNLAGDVKALDEFGAFGKKYDEATAKATPPLSRRSSPRTQF